MMIRGAAVLGVGMALALPAEAALGFSPAQIFALADQARAAGRSQDALAFYGALSHDPDIEIRSEARFRKGILLADEKRYREAAVAFRALLDEKPDAARVRLELARVLALMGDEEGARRQLRQARAVGLPANIAIVVDHFANALRSTDRFGGSVELDLAPDSNINRSTDSRTLDTVIAPLNLSRDARARSGIGVKVNAQGFARLPVADAVSILGRLSTSASLYRAQQFDDVSVSGAVGPDIHIGRDRLQPSIGYSQRYYGGHLYARTASLSAEWRHPVGKRSQLEVDASAARARYDRNSLQDGRLYDGSATFEHAFRPSFGGSLTLNVDRQTARDPGYATIAGGVTGLLWHDFGKTTLFGTATYRHLGSDARFLLFPKSRTDDFYRLSVGATLRRFTVKGFAPVLHVAWERNRSTVGLYDYRRISMDMGIARAF
jgi:tetratricopeptide (TPR) repeat protein